MTSLHRPVKSLGQNFLIDTRIQQKIVDVCALQPDESVVEIGPGKGAITRLVLPLVRKLTVIEKDRLLAHLLKEELRDPKLEVIEGDFLRWDMSGLPDGSVVIGNIPYYISTPIIEHLLEHRAKISRIFMMVQLEFGQRLAAKAGSEDYGSLSCFVQYYMDVKLLFKISPGSFHPQPKVQSCFVSLIIKKEPGYVGAGHVQPVQAKDESKLFKMIQTAFTQRRKTIVNALKFMGDQDKIAEELQRLKIDLKSRPENLTLLNYIELCNKLMI